jgi:hypothetical protein
MTSPLIHDTATAAAWHIVETVAPALREEERRDAAEEFYRVLVATLEAYHQLAFAETFRNGASCN